MRISSIAALAGLAGLGAASNDAEKRYWTNVECKEKTVTVTDYYHTKTVTMGPDGKPMEASPGPEAGSSMWTKDGKVTSVDYTAKPTSTYLPDKGVYPHPYRAGWSLTCDGPKWTDVDMPVSTVYVYPTGKSPNNKKDCVKAIYQDVIIVEVVVIEIIETVEGDKTVCKTGTTKTDKPAYTPPPPYNSPPPKEQNPNPPPSSTLPYMAPGATKVVELRAIKDGDKTTVLYKPDRVDAEVGDVILFKFFAAAHSATQSTFDTPCTPLKDGFDSGLIPNANNTEGAGFTREFQVRDKNPVWFYCKQPNKNHCGQGMVFGINPNGKMDKFIENAKKQNGALVDQPPPPAASTSTPPPTVTPPPEQKPADGWYHPAATMTVTVEGGINLETGENTLKFDPPLIKRVEKGTTLLFDFRKLNHTLTESTLENPCKKKDAGALDTNFQNFNAQGVPLQNATAFVVDTAPDVPRWFYCKQANGKENGHCKNGMLFAINTNEAKFEEFKKNAKNTEVKPAGRRARRYDA